MSDKDTTRHAWAKLAQTLAEKEKKPQGKKQKKTRSNKQWQK